MVTGTRARVDSWIWAVRLVKTRSLATAACRAGHVKVNGEKAKAAQSVKIGDEIRYRESGFDKIVVVGAILVKRVSALHRRGKRFRSRRFVIAAQDARPSGSGVTSRNCAGATPMM